MFALSVIIPVMIAITIGFLTDSWIWGLVSGFVTLPLSVAAFSFLAGLMFGYPNRYSRKWASVIRAGRNTDEPPERDVLIEIVRTQGTTLLRKQIRGSDAGETSTVGLNPFQPTDGEVLTATLLGSPSSDTERLETILKKLLKKEYSRYYRAARQRVISQLH